jgi:hypothetical protein
MLGLAAIWWQSVWQYGQRGKKHEGSVSIGGLDGHGLDGNGQGK